MDCVVIPVDLQLNVGGMAYNKVSKFYLYWKPTKQQKPIKQRFDGLLLLDKLISNLYVVISNHNNHWCATLHR